MILSVPSVPWPVQPSSSCGTNGNKDDGGASGSMAEYPPVAVIVSKLEPHPLGTVSEKHGDAAVELKVNQHITHPKTPADVMRKC